VSIDVVVLDVQALQPLPGHGGIPLPNDSHIFRNKSKMVRCLLFLLVLLEFELKVSCFY
jgi:hypothetical protein